MTAASTDNCRVRVVCIGETMVMFGPPPHELIEYCSHFVALLGGAEANVAIGLERLGMHAGWVGKLPQNALGRKLVNETRSFGVDTSAVVWSETGRVGTFFVEWGAAPRPLVTIYDRAGSAATTLAADELDWDYLLSAEWVVLTGITPALSDTCRATTLEIACRARQAGVRVAFDMNYRSLLWSRDEARKAYRALLPHVDLLVATEPDVEIVLGKHLERRDALRALADCCGAQVIAMTLGAEGALGYECGAFHQVPGYDVQCVNRLGAGDAFLAGLIYGFSQWNLRRGLAYGIAMAALKMTVPQNIPLINRVDVERLVAGRNSDVIR
jgi:2-dehydro-3-deoxygluconokinase